MYSVLISIAVAFASSYLITPHLISFFKASLVVGEDQQKIKKPKLPTSGGIGITIGTVAGIFTYITVQIFYYKNPANLIEILAIVSSILIAAFTG